MQALAIYNTINNKKSVPQNTAPKPTPNHLSPDEKIVDLMEKN